MVSYWFQILDEEFKPQGYKVPTGVAPNVLVKFIGCFDKTVKMLAPSLGKVSPVIF